MNRSDDDIKGFFAEMKNDDHKVGIPDFDDLKKTHQPKRRYLLPLGIAASLLMMVSVYFILDQKQDQHQVVELIITLGNEEPINTQKLITKESTIDAWTSPTSSLIADF